MLRASMPKATIKEDGDAEAGEDKICCKPEGGQGPGRDSVTETTAMDLGSNGHFWTGIAVAVGLHRGPDGIRGSPRHSRFSQLVETPGNTQALYCNDVKVSQICG